jgi:hypothetical protein
MENEQMAGRPRTQHKRIAAIVARLKALQGRLIELIPDQYKDYTIDDSSLPCEDLGRSWRDAIETVMSALEQVEWLEYLLNEKAKLAAMSATPEEADEVNDGADDLDVPSAEELSTAEDSEPQPAPQTESTPKAADS